MGQALEKFVYAAGKMTLQAHLVQRGRPSGTFRTAKRYDGRRSSSWSPAGGDMMVGHRSPRAAAAVAAVATLLAAACAPLTPIREVFDPPTPRERYAESLRSAGLEETALGRDWLAAADRALREPFDARPPYRGVGHLPAERPTAKGYRLALRRGQELRVMIEWEMAEPGVAFVDFFILEPPAGAERPDPAYRHLVSADTSGRSIALEVPRDGEYVLRLQAELLRSARYELVVVTAPVLAFPVDGHDVTAIRSSFGDPRDGGRRTHDGVDIFAPRGTPVLAAATGRVSRVGTNRLGGNTIWVQDETRGLRLYYAHLDRQLVRGGERVRPGDTLGLVGNTGNARTTPPHLHFGVYVRGEGPLDPHPFLFTSPDLPPELDLDAATLGGWVRTTRRVHLRPTAGTDEAPLATLEPDTPLRATGGSGGWYRVSLPDGRRGFVSAALVEPHAAPEEGF